MEHILQRSKNERKNKKMPLKTIVLGTALLIPALIVYLSVVHIGRVSANSPLSDNMVYNDIFSTENELGLNSLYDIDINDYPFGLNLIEIETKEGSYIHFTEYSRVSEIIEEIQLAYDDNDVIVPYLDEVLASGAKLKLIQVESEIVEEFVSIPFDVIRENDPSVDVGNDTVSQNGINGEKMISYELKFEDGNEVSKIQISESILTPPVNKVIKVGTRKPIPHSTLQSGTCASWDAVIDSMTTNEEERGWLKGLMRCESGCNANRVSRNGSYHGLFQFSPRTFAAYGGTNIYDGYQQLPLVLNWVRAGVQYSQFPACSRGH